MPNNLLLEELKRNFKSCYSKSEDGSLTVISYAPGRVEVLGNHTDYNEGFVLSAAINRGTFFLIGETSLPQITITSFNVGDSITFQINDIVNEAKTGQITTSKDKGWSNYIKGVLIEIIKKVDTNQVSGFNALFGGDLGLGLGLSSSAALEVSSGLAISNFYNVQFTNDELAKIGQKSEHNYVGVKCGLLDQITSIYGKESNLVKTDFRSLEVENVPLDSESCFLVCNTKVTHSLVTSEYNERRESCEKASKYFADNIKEKKITHLRDVNSTELEQHKEKMDKVVSMRAAHIIGENERVIKGKELLSEGKMSEFGKLMFESHESSIHNFENSCKELDIIVSLSKSTKEVLGARLSGGGFGGAVLVLINSKDEQKVKQEIERLYYEKLESHCDIQSVVPSLGARLILSKSQ